MNTPPQTQEESCHARREGESCDEDEEEKYESKSYDDDDSGDCSDVTKLDEEDDLMCIMSKSLFASQVDGHMDRNPGSIRYLSSDLIVRKDLIRTLCRAMRWLRT